VSEIKLHPNINIEDEFFLSRPLIHTLKEQKKEILFENKTSS
jgi:hypothetical protein